jgi:hypothetical protein
MNLDKFFQSKALRWAMVALAIIIVLGVVFKIGMAVGFAKARFSYNWGENYHKNFAGPKDGFFPMMERRIEGRDFIESRGVFGQIIKINDADIVVRGRDNVEVVVLIKDSTTIAKGRQAITIKELVINDNVVIMGEPNGSGQIEAKLIRVMPPQSLNNNLIPPAL